jgi:DNA-binding NarL/FixJ family response regulator
MRTPPLIVVEHDKVAFRGIASELERSAFRLHHGWDPPQPSRSDLLVCVGDVCTRDETAAALYSAVSGHGVLAHVPHTRAELATFIDDLARVGPVEFRSSMMGADISDEPHLDGDERDLLRLLAHGQTIAEAGADLHISLRTANRRLARARARLGAASTAEAVHIARSRGLC